MKNMIVATISFIFLSCSLLNNERLISNHKMNSSAISLFSLNQTHSFQIFTNKGEHEHYFKNLITEILSTLNTKSISEDLKKKIISLIRTIHTIHYKDYDCSKDQVACTEPGEQGTIFLNHLFFKLSSNEQFSTLLHEAFHLKHQDFHHVLCKKRQWGHQCDEHLNSAYGIEYQIALALEDTELTKRIALRINKIIESIN